MKEHGESGPLARALVLAALCCCLASAGCRQSGGGGGADAGDGGQGDGGDTDSGSETDSGSDTSCLAGECCVDEECPGEGMICNELWGVCAVADCEGHGDFTPCEKDTTGYIHPDRGYDICIDGVCRSPGCGEVECNPPGPHFPLPDSGQLSCWGDWHEMECPQPGEAFYGQDSQFGWDTLHDWSERYQRVSPVPGEPVVEDAVTGLIWTGCRAGLGGDDCGVDLGGEKSLSWEDALDYCEALCWAGLCDWRLPDRYELETLVDADKGWVLDEEVFPPWEEYANEAFWSLSRSGADVSPFAVYYLYTLDGSLKSIDYLKNHSVLCVRGRPAVFEGERFERDTSVEHQAVVHDRMTGLYWAGCPKGVTGDQCESGEPESVSWEDALAHCELLSELSWGGRDDWRLPNRVELSSLTLDRGPGESLDAEAFPFAAGDEGYSAWTSTSRLDYGYTTSDDAIQAYSVNLSIFRLGYKGKDYFDQNTTLALCTAGGQ
ncbi:MAG: DUF1566 domain-containing protein [Polyangia bacterium]